MSNQNTSSAEAQGAKAEFTASTFEAMLLRDLPVAIACLNALYSDPDLIKSMAAFMAGRHANAQLKPTEEVVS